MVRTAESVLDTLKNISKNFNISENETKSQYTSLMCVCANFLNLILLSFMFCICVGIADCVNIAFCFHANFENNFFSTFCS